MACTIDAVRLRISDTDSNDPLLTDSEINQFIDDANGNCDEAAGRALLSLAASKARLEDARKVYSIEITTRELAERLMELARVYFNMASSGKDGSKTIVQPLKVPPESDWGDDEHRLDQWGEYLEEVYDTDTEY